MIYVVSAALGFAVLSAALAMCGSRSRSKRAKDEENNNAKDTLEDVRKVSVAASNDIELDVVRVAEQPVSEVAIVLETVQSFVSVPGATSSDDDKDTKKQAAIARKVEIAKPSGSSQGTDEHGFSELPADRHRISRFPDDTSASDQSSDSEDGDQSADQKKWANVRIKAADDATAGASQNEISEHVRTLSVNMGNIAQMRASRAQTLGAPTASAAGRQRNTWAQGPTSLAIVEELPPKARTPSPNTSRHGDDDHHKASKLANISDIWAPMRVSPRPQHDGRRDSGSSAGSCNTPTTAGKKDKADSAFLLLNGHAHSTLPVAGMRPRAATYAPPSAASIAAAVSAFNVDHTHNRNNNNSSRSQQPSHRNWQRHRQHRRG
eukprot:m.131012 g.131012  ORF g.131012 m.131012 type:complete len:378 (+) comp16448_c3_seq1:108-1241(+)